MKKKGIGISLAYIVVIILAALTLIILYLWGSENLGKGLRGASQLQEATDAEMAAAKLKCDSLCAEAKKEAETLSEFKESRYCTEKLTVGSEAFHCYDKKINHKCAFKVKSNGKIVDAVC